MLPLQWSLKLMQCNKIWEKTLKHEMRPSRVRDTSQRKNEGGEKWVYESGVADTESHNLVWNTYSLYLSF